MSPTSKLTGKQRRHLRGLGHSLEPVAHIGKDGLSDGFVEAVDRALTDHELIKVKVGGTADVDRKQVGIDLANKTGSELAQVIGNMLLLFRAHPKKPTIRLPASK